jgi:hypothetical protein
MLFLVQAAADVDTANRVDASGGPGPAFAKIAERFRPQAFYGNPTRRELVMIVELETPAKVAELMFVLTYFSGREPTFTPLTKLEIFGEALKNAKEIISPPK